MTRRSLTRPHEHVSINPTCDFGRILANIERDEYGGDGFPRRARRQRPSSVPPSRPLFPPSATARDDREPEDPAAAAVLAEIRRQTPDRLTPLEALALIDGWSRRLKKGPPRGE